MSVNSQARIALDVVHVVGPLCKGQVPTARHHRSCLISRHTDEVGHRLAL